MKKLIVRMLAVVGLAAIVVGGVHLWNIRPWRVAISVNGHVLTAGELDMRAQTILNDHARMTGLLIPKSRMKQAIAELHCDRRAAQMWIVKEILLAEAVARGTEVDEKDEKESLKLVANSLKSRNMTPEQFFKEGPIPEEIKRRDFRETMLINKFMAKEVTDKIQLDTKEIDARFAEMQKAAAERAKKTQKKVAPPTRKMAIDSLRQKRYQQGFREMFRSLYGKAVVKCPAFPDLETLKGVSPDRAEDKAKTAPRTVVKPAAASAKPTAAPAPAKPTAAPAPAKPTVVPAKSASAPVPAKSEKK